MDNFPGTLACIALACVFINLWLHVSIPASAEGAGNAGAAANKFPRRCFSQGSFKCKKKKEEKGFFCGNHGRRSDFLRSSCSVLLPRRPIKQNPVYLAKPCNVNQPEEDLSKVPPLLCKTSEDQTRRWRGKDSSIENKHFLLFGHCVLFSSKHEKQKQRLFSKSRLFTQRAGVHFKIFQTDCKSRSGKESCHTSMWLTDSSWHGSTRPSVMLLI